MERESLREARRRRIPFHVWLRTRRSQRVRWLGWMLFLRRWVPFGTFAVKG